MIRRCLATAVAVAPNAVFTASAIAWAVGAMSRWTFVGVCIIVSVINLAHVMRAR